MTRRLMLLAALALALGAPAPAYATLQVSVLECGSPILAITDGSVGDLDPHLGAIDVDVSILNQFLQDTVFQSLTASSNAVTEMGSPGVLEHSAVFTADHDCDCSGAAITIISADSDYVSSDPSLTITSTSSVAIGNAQPGDSLMFQSWFNPSNTQFGTEIPFPTIVQPLDADGNATATSTLVVPGGFPYSLTNRSDITLECVPEPSTLVGAGPAILLGLGYGWRRRKAKAA